MRTRHQIRNMGRDLGMRRLEMIEENRALKGLAAGLVGGLAASWVMTQFQSAWSKLSEALSKRREEKQSGQEQSEGGEEPATVAVAEAISTKVAHRPLTKHQKQIAGPAVHYAYGTLLGGLVWHAGRKDAGGDSRQGDSIWRGSVAFGR